MKIAIETVDLVEPGVFGFVEAQLRATLEPVANDVDSVHLSVTDVNGPHRGGVDKHCVVRLKLRDGVSASFDDVHSDARAAVALVSTRLSRWVSGGRRRSSLPPR